MTMIAFARAVLPLFMLFTGSGAAHYRRHRSAHEKHRARHLKQSHHRERRRVASFAHMQHENNMMLAKTEAAEAQLSDASNDLAELLLDVSSNATGSNATSPALRGSKSSSNSSAVFSANVTTNLKSQQRKLDDLFKHLKLNIANFNKREAEQKQDGQEYAKKIQERLEKDRKRLQDSSLSAFDHEMLVNRTRMEERELKFWTRGRELQHDMFHSNLKLTHGLMSRVKSVMEAYKQMLATGKVDSKLTKALHDSLPKAFIQKETQLKKDVRRLGNHLKVTAALLNRQ